MYSLRSRGKGNGKDYELPAVVFINISQEDVFEKGRDEDLAITLIVAELYHRFLQCFDDVLNLFLQNGELIHVLG